MDFAVSFETLIENAPLMAPADVDDAASGTLLLPEPDEEENVLAAFNYVPLASAAYLDEKGFLPMEHWKSNHPLMRTMLRRALFNDELIRFIKTQSVDIEEADKLATTAWTQFTKMRSAYTTTERTVIRDHLYAKYRPNAAVPAALNPPPIDVIYASGRKYDTWSIELKLQRQKEGEDIEVPSILNLDITAVISAQQNRPMTPIQTAANHKRVMQLALDTINQSAPAPLRKRSRNCEIVSLEEEIAQIKQLLEAKERQLVLMKTM